MATRFAPGTHASAHIAAYYEAEAQRFYDEAVLEQNLDLFPHLWASHPLAKASARATRRCHEADIAAQYSHYTAGDAFFAQQAAKVGR